MYDTLGLTITLDDRAGERQTKEIENFRLDRGAAGDHEPHFASKTSLRKSSWMKRRAATHN
jgi:hypothetical protein